jgi:hypothetical protein
MVQTAKLIRVLLHTSTAHVALDRKNTAQEKSSPSQTRVASACHNPKTPSSKTAPGDSEATRRTGHEGITSVHKYFNPDPGFSAEEQTSKR